MAGLWTFAETMWRSWSANYTRIPHFCSIYSFWLSGSTTITTTVQRQSSTSQCSVRPLGHTTVGTPPRIEMPVARILGKLRKVRVYAGNASLAWESYTNNCTRVCRWRGWCSQLATPNFLFIIMERGVKESSIALLGGNYPHFMPNTSYYISIVGGVLLAYGLDWHDAFMDEYWYTICLDIFRQLKNWLGNRYCW